MPRSCVYTCLFGSYEVLLEQPVRAVSELDFICFTDNKKITSDTWQVRYVNAILPLDAPRSSRHAKLLPHKYLADYETSLYIDNAIRLLVDPLVILDFMLSETDFDASFFRHSFRASLFEEFGAVQADCLEAPDRIAECLEHVINQAPSTLEERPLWGGMIARRHMRENVIIAMEQWMTLVLRYSRRDQLTLPSIVAIEKIRVNVLNCDIHKSKYHEWPIDASRDRANYGLPLAKAGKSKILSLLEDNHNLRWSIASIQDSLANMRSKNIELQDLLEKESAKALILQDLLNRLHTSTSWRVSSPFRHYASILKAMKAKALKSGPLIISSRLLPMFRSTWQNTSPSVVDVPFRSMPVNQSMAPLDDSSGDFSEPLQDVKEASLIPATPVPCQLGFDSIANLFFVSDDSFPRKIFLSDKKRFDLYKVNGVRARLNWLQQDYRILGNIIKKGDTIVDVGANNGELGLHESFASVNYIAIEPDPVAFSALRLNHPNAILSNQALSNVVGSQEFYLCSAEADSSLFRPTHFTSKIDVEVCTLDSCLEALGIVTPIKLLKIEAEGMEPEVLAGGERTLAKTKFLALDAGPERGEESPAPACLNLLFKMGYEICDVYLLRGTFFLENKLLHVN